LLFDFRIDSSEEKLISIQETPDELQEGDYNRGTLFSGKKYDL